MINEKLERGMRIKYRGAGGDREAEVLEVRDEVQSGILEVSVRGVTESGIEKTFSIYVPTRGRVRFA